MYIILILEPADLPGQTMRCGSAPGAAGRIPGGVYAAVPLRYTIESNTDDQMLMHRASGGSAADTSPRRGIGVEGL